MEKPLANTLALVTGSSRGIGAAIARRFAADGAAVIVGCWRHPDCAENVVAEIRNAGGEAQAVQADLATLEGVRAVIAAVDNAFGRRFEGRLDILVNNAGTVEFKPFLETSDEAYATHFDLNVRAPVLLAKDAAKRMAKTGWGRIINIGSAVGEAVPFPGISHYVATKFALHGLTRTLSRELGALGITVNGIEPGPIVTALSPKPGTPDYDMMIKLVSVGRFGKVEEIANAAAWLAHPDASFVNGENLRVDGGMVA